MTSTAQARTIGELRKSGYQVLPVRDELRNNLIKKIRSEEIVFPGIIGFDDTVIPQLDTPQTSGVPSSRQLRSGD